MNLLVLTDTGFRNQRITGLPTLLVYTELVEVRPQPESNGYHLLRKQILYPLSYGG